MYCESRVIHASLPRCDDIVTHVVVGEHNTYSESGDGTGRLLWFKVCESCRKMTLRQRLAVEIIPIKDWEAYIHALHSGSTSGSDSGFVCHPSGSMVVGG